MASMLQVPVVWQTALLLTDVRQLVCEQCATLHRRKVALPAFTNQDHFGATDGNGIGAIARGDFLGEWASIDANPAEVTAETTFHR